MTATLTRPVLSEYRAGFPNICGWESEIQAVTSRPDPVFLPRTDLRLENLRAGFANALHMHQPTIPAGKNGELISNLQYMLEQGSDEDRYNAGIFAWCYSRMGEFIPDLVAQGCSPRIMLDYSGNLLWGICQMGRTDILEKLKKITCDPQYQPYVEWLGTMWSHAVVPSTPIPDIKLHIQAWQHHFAAIFGLDALARVKGFSPPEMHLPNHPDTLYEYVKALKDCGYRWLMVQEHSVENLDGSGLHHDQKYIPNRLVARNSRGEEVAIVALIKTQGSDTKLVAQMQPYYEAKGKNRQTIAGITIPSLVTQIADGENGGVMMNEFPPNYLSAWQDIRNNPEVAGINGTEYLELLADAGIKETDFPAIQALHQHKIWQKVGDQPTPDKVQSAIAELKQSDHRFHVEGASWTNNISWVRGYENVLEPMQKLSAAFHAKYDPLVASNPDTKKQDDYLQALVYNLLVQTSCFRYWGQGRWTDYARTLYDRGMALL